MIFRGLYTLNWQKLYTFGNNFYLMQYRLVCLKLMVLLAVLMTGLDARSQTPDTAAKSSKVNSKRVVIVAASGSLALAAAYVYMQHAWWSEQSTTFKFDDGADLLYAKNMDKVGHFIGGNVTAELFGEAFQWAGVKKSKSYLYGGLMGVFVQSAIEIKDGFAPTYGYSIGDLAAGSAGSFLPMLQYHVPAAKAFRIKVSYYRHNNYYYDVYPYANIIDDYANQTYWLSVSVNDLLPKGSKAERIWPDFLTLVGGWGVDHTLNGYHTGVNLYENRGRGKYEYYVSVDVDWRKIIKQNTLFNRSVTYALNYIKLPLPTLRLGPQMQYHWAFW